MATYIAIGQCQDFRSLTIGGSIGDGAGKIATGARARVAFTTGAPVKKES